METAHLLLALLRDDILVDQAETAGAVLRLLGFVDLADIRNRALQETGKPPLSGAPASCSFCCLPCCG